MGVEVCFELLVIVQGLVVVGGCGWLWVAVGDCGTPVVAWGFWWLFRFIGGYFGLLVIFWAREGGKR